jgi:hypothetical protein
MKINIYVIIIIVCIVLFGLLYIKQEGYIDYSEYNTIDRIKTLDGEYAYCIAGEVQCVSGNLIQISDLTPKLYNKKKATYKLYSWRNQRH